MAQRKDFQTLRQIENRIDGIYNSAAITKINGDEIHEQLNEHVFEPLNSKTPRGRNRYTKHERYFAKGYSMARYNDVMNWKTEHCYLVDGELYSTNKNTTKRRTNELHDAGRSRELNDAPSAIYWLNSDKIYFQSKDEARKQARAKKQAAIN
jgi:hypothetical protein